MPSWAMPRLCLSGLPALAALMLLLPDLAVGQGVAGAPDSGPSRAAVGEPTTDPLHRGRPFTTTLAGIVTLEGSGERLDRARALETELRERAAEDPSDPGVRWMIIAAMSLQVDEESARGKVQITRRILDEVELLGALAPDHPGYHHAKGRLHAGVMRSGPVLRWVAQRLVGGELLRSASWAEAERHFERAAELEPRALHHRLELGQVLLDQGKRDAAHAPLRAVVETPSELPLDTLLRERATVLLGDESEG